MMGSGVRVPPSALQESLACAGLCCSEGESHITIWSRNRLVGPGSFHPLGVMTAISWRATLGQIGRPPRTFETRRGTAMSTFLWIVLVVLYLTALISLGMMTLRKGHTLLF